MIHGDPSLPYLNLTVHRAPAWRTQRPGWWRTVLAAALAGSGAAAIAAEPERGGDEIEGAWQVVSVEFAGQPLPGLEGARLVLLRGRKTFTLLSGATEEGTYALDPTRELKWMDSTTGGRTSTTLHNLYKRRGAMLASFAELMPFNDLVAVSYYPFFMPDRDRLSALDWERQSADQVSQRHAEEDRDEEARQREQRIPEGNQGQPPIFSDGKIGGRPWF